MLDRPAVQFWWNAAARSGARRGSTSDIEVHQTGVLIMGVGFSSSGRPYDWCLVSFDGNLFSEWR